MSVPICIVLNGLKKLIQPDKDIQTVFNCLLIDIFCKQVAEEELVRSEKVILFLLLKEIPFQCVVITKDQLDKFKESAKRYNIAYHVSEHILSPELQVLFFREADSVTFNEIIHNNNISVIINLGSIRSEDPDMEQHKRAAMANLSDEGMLDIYKLFLNYTDDGGTVEELKNYLRTMAIGPLFETLMQSNQIKGIKFDELFVPTDEPELQELDPESAMKGGHGTTDYFEKIKAIEKEALRGTKP